MIQMFLFTLNFLFLLFSVSSSQIVSQHRAEEFVRAIVLDTVDIFPYLSRYESSRVNRLGISYENVRNKCLIGFDIDKTVKSIMRMEKNSYSVCVEELNDGYSRIKVSALNSNYFKYYYFDPESSLVSPIYYHTRSWKQFESSNFVFHISDTTLFNRYAIDCLEKFIEYVARLFEYSYEQRNRLRSEKIHYFLCSNEDEIEKVTGFRTRGITIIAYDYVVTTYNCHYHELVHLLMNFKFESIPLYTHPFFQEGIATALGGRGGLEAQVVLNTGRYLETSGFCTYKKLLSRKTFIEQDASITYPVAGLYSAFLLDRLGFKQYAQLYRSYSGHEKSVDSMVISENILPLENELKKFLSDSLRFASITLDKGNNQYWQQSNYTIKMKDALFLTPQSRLLDYRSKKFYEIFPGKRYQGEKYIIICSKNEISIYNLYTNNLIANYISAFSTTTIQSASTEGWYIFSVSKTIFDEPLENLEIKYDAN